MTIVVNEVTQRNTGLTGGFFLIDAKFLAHSLKIGAAIGQLFPNAVKLTEYAHLHLLCGLVGERNGQSGAITHRILDKQFDVLNGKAECFSATGAGLVND